MLKSIDIFIALAVVMLVASMAVTVMTGFVTHVFNTRGRNLKGGIADLLRLLDPGFSEQAVNQIAKGILTHPLIRDKKNRMGNVIHREELTKLLMELAAGCGWKPLEAAVQTRLKETLKAQGIDDPAQTLSNIRALALQLEKSSPELSNMARANLAILHEADSHFVAKINTWFDQTMDRVSQRFTNSARVITFVCGLILAAVLQLDTVALVNRISVDDAVRGALVKQAATISPDAKGGDAFANIVDNGVIPLPKYPDDVSKFGDLRHLFGIVMTTLLLSLGAPFWYSALGQLLQLRSKIAQQDDVQRNERQSSQDAVLTPAGPAAMSPGILSGERGDLGAVG